MLADDLHERHEQMVRPNVVTGPDTEAAQLALLRPR
jgi:hypothetical protein